MASRPLQLIALASPPRRPHELPHDAALLALLTARGAPPPRAAAPFAQRHRGRPLADLLLARGLVRPADLLAAEAELRGATLIDPALDPPDPRLVAQFGAAECLAQGLLPWRRLGGVTVVATARPDLFARREAALVARFGPVALALAEETAIAEAVLRLHAAALAHRAETLCPAAESCRSWSAVGLRRAALLALGVIALLALLPGLGFAALLLWAAMTLAGTAGLKAAAALAQGLARSAPPTVATAAAPAIARPPIVSLLVPLLGEADIAPRLLARLARLDYPRELLDVLLIVEAEDTATAAALARGPLPPWVRLLTVPPGRLKTKPRALNYALPFCRGSIVGVYDAEDAPDPDQIARVVARFHARGPRVACLQGILDFYNPRRNWLSRCFTVEYAAWFRIVLPGLARLGLPVPLGGTTLFFRRAALEALGGWDAHNVTEDADLGLRLARHGYVTELIEVVTEEEANCRPGAWIRQRARWLKGYMMTYAVHMRDPALLLRQLGLKRFLGVQLLFLGTLSQFLLAPVLWSCWALALGLPHPLAGLPGPLLTALIGLFLAAELVNLVVNLAAVSGPKHRWLLPWVPTLALYFPLGALAAYRGAWDILVRPFFWDKTRHGLDPAEPPATEPAASAAAQLLTAS